MAPIKQRKWNVDRLSEEVTSSSEQTIEWLQNAGLISKSMNCPQCKSPCILSPHDSPDEYTWKCESKDCGAFTPVRANSFFVVSRLSLKQLVTLLCCWCSGHSVKGTAFHLQMVESCVEIWFKMLSHMFESKHRALHSSCSTCNGFTKPLNDYESEQLAKEKEKVDYDIRRAQWSQDAKEKMYVDDITLVNGQLYHLYRIPDVPVEFAKRFEIIPGPVPLAPDKNRKPSDFDLCIDTLKNIYAPKDVYDFENLE